MTAKPQDSNGASEAREPKSRDELRSIEECFRLLTNHTKRLLTNEDEHRRFMGLAWLYVNRSQQVRNCTPQSIFDCIVQAAQLRLEIGGPRQLASLVAYRNVCTFVTGYRGLVLLARRAGVARVLVDAVYPGDKFEVHRGTTPGIIHRPRYDVERSDEKVIATYCVYWNTTDPNDFEFAVAERWQLDKRREQALKRIPKENQDFSPWVSWPLEQYLKTAVRIAARLMPQSDELAMALEVENRVDGVPAAADPTDANAVAHAEAQAAGERREGLKARMRVLTEGAAQPIPIADPELEKEFARQAAEDAEQRGAP